MAFGVLLSQSRNAARRWVSQKHPVVYLKMYFVTWLNLFDYNNMFMLYNYGSILF